MQHHSLELEELRPLDLSSRNTVSEIVDGLRYCSFGARMLGEVTASLEEIIKHKEHIIMIYNGKPDTPLARLLRQFVEKRWVAAMMPSEHYSSVRSKQDTLLLVGQYDERDEDAIYKAARTIFINPYRMVKPGQVKDGYFPDVVFSDPNYIMPVLYAALEERLEGKRISTLELMRTLTGYPRLAHQVAHGADTLYEMIADPDCAVYMTISGAMTIAKMGLLICDMIEQGMVQGIAATGALIAHGLVEGIGLKHYKYNPDHPDTLLADQKLNRVTDTLEPEENLNFIEKEVIHKVMAVFEEEKKTTTPRLVLQEIGKFLQERYPQERAILKSAYLREVPIVVPAFVDSELGNDAHIFNFKRTTEGKDPIYILPGPDSQHLIDMMAKSKRLGIFSIGGGTPRNYIQNIAPLIELLNERLSAGYPSCQFSYGCRIAPDPMDYGHLSGSTYPEMVSWRKFNPHGRFTEIQADATLVWPFLVKYVQEKQQAA